MRHTWPLVLAVAVGSLATTATALSCSSAHECCDVCGPDSYRCARGPCSSNFVTKGFFSISLPTTSVGFWDVLFAFYGMVPYLVPIALALDLLFHKRTWTRVFAFLFIPIVAVINALILVKSLSDCAECARPCGSCIVSKGMPSGHATNAIGLCLWLVLEALLGIGRRWHTPKQVAVMLASVLLFVPVPYSRVYLGDHTPLQVTIGSVDGLVFGLAYFLILRFVVAKQLDRATQWLASGRCSIAVTNDFCEKSLALNSAPTSPLSDVVEMRGPDNYAQAPGTPLV